MFLPSPTSPLPPDHGWSGATRRLLPDRIAEELRYLRDEVETRRVGAMGEAQAAGYVAGRLRRSDFGGAVQSFRAGGDERFALVLVIGMAAAAGAVAVAVPGRLTAFAALLVVLAAVWLLFAETGVVGRDGEPLRRLRRGATSQSVIAARAAQGQQTRWRVIVLAPLDGPPRSALGRAGLLLTLAALAGLAAALVGQLVEPDGIWRWGAGLCAALLAVQAVVVLLRRPTASHSAAYGAGELATLLMVSEELPLLHSVEVWMVALGGGSVGGASIRSLVERYPFSPADTWVINLHNITAGQPIFVTREGVLRERRSPSMLQALAGETEAADLHIDAEPRRLRRSTAAQAFTRKGFGALTISSHAGGEPYAGPDPFTIERCVRLVVGIIHRLDE